MNDTILILHATQTGTAEDLADDAAQRLKEAGFSTRHFDVYDTDISILKQYPICLFLASTWGEGEPPDDAEDFYISLDGAEGLDLSHLKFAVFGLGDSGYENFNGCGKGFDRMLGERGATRMLPRVDCDIDIDEPFEEWINECVLMCQVSLLVERAATA